MLLKTDCAEWSAPYNQEEGILVQSRPALLVVTIVDSRRRSYCSYCFQSGLYILLSPSVFAAGSIYAERAIEISGCQNLRNMNSSVLCRASSDDGLQYFTHDSRRRRRQRQNGFSRCCGHHRDKPRRSHNDPARIAAVGASSTTLPSVPWRRVLHCQTLPKQTRRSYESTAVYS